MTRQQLMRRMVLGAFAVALALPGFGTAAEGGPYAEGSTSGPGFKGYCEDGGGIFTDTQDGNLWCQWDDDSQTVCDEDGDDCHDIPIVRPPGRRPPIGVDSPIVADPLIADEGTLPPVVSDPALPVTGSSRGSDRQPNMTAPSTDQEQDHRTNQQTKGKQGKKGTKGGKHRRR